MKEKKKKGSEDDHDIEPEILPQRNKQASDANRVIQFPSIFDITT